MQVLLILEVLVIGRAAAALAVHRRRRHRLPARRRVDVRRARRTRRRAWRRARRRRGRAAGRLRLVIHHLLIARHGHLAAALHPRLHRTALLPRHVGSHRRRHALVAARTRVVVAAVAVGGDRLIVGLGRVGGDRLVVGLGRVARDRLVIAALDVFGGALHLRARVAAAGGGGAVGRDRRGGEVAGGRGAGRGPVLVPACDLEDIVPAGFGRGRGQRRAQESGGERGQGFRQGFHGTVSSIVSYWVRTPRSCSGLKHHGPLDHGRRGPVAGTSFSA